MKFIRRIVSVLLLTVLLFAVTPVKLAAEEQKVDLVDMHSIGSDYAKVIDEGITDSFGNKYDRNVLEIGGNSYGFIIYDLKGEYSRFDASIVCRDDALSESSLYVGIYVDGVLAYELDGYNKRTEKKTLSIDVKGAGQLAIKVADVVSGRTTEICFVESFFTKAEQALPYPTRLMINDVFQVDSKEAKVSSKLFLDPMGKVHNGYILLNEGYIGWGSNWKRESYAIYNLDKKYESISGKVVLDKWKTGCEGAFYIYVDDKLVFSKKNLKPNSAYFDFDVDVKDKGVIKFVASGYTGRTDSGTEKVTLYVTDTIVRSHEHKTGEVKIEKEATCTAEGLKKIFCKDCGELIGEEIIPATGHKGDGNFVVTKEPSCSETGIKAQHCSVCGAEIDPQPIDKIPHTISSEWKTVREASCSEEGLRQKVCTVCGEVMETESIPMLDHSFGNWKSVSEHFWDNPVKEERVCSLCGATETRETNNVLFIALLAGGGAFLLLVITVVIIISVTRKKKKAKANATAAGTSDNTKQ